MNAEVREKRVEEIIRQCQIAYAGIGLISSVFPHLDKKIRKIVFKAIVENSEKRLEAING